MGGLPAEPQIVSLAEVEDAPAWVPRTEDERALARYSDALELLVEGRTIAQAARETGHREASLRQALWRHPAVFGELKRRREVLRELAHVRALGKAMDKLGDDLSARDVTDLIRATKPAGEARGASIRLEIDW